MRKICIDPGHQAGEPGATYQGIKEKDITLAVAIAAAYKLNCINPDEYNVILTRTGDISLGATKIEELKKRCQIAISQDCEIFVSIHCNADADPDEPGMPEAKGEEIWYREGSENGLKLAQYLKDWIDLVFPDEPFRGIKATTGFYVLNGTYEKMASVLIEIGFIDKSSSKNIFTDTQTIGWIGDLIANGIHDYLLQTEKEDKT